LQAQCQSPTRQSFVKELAKLTHLEKLLKKYANKKDENKITLKRKLNNYNDLQP